MNKKAVKPSTPSRPPLDGLLVSPLPEMGLYEARFDAAGVTLGWTMRACPLEAVSACLHNAAFWMGQGKTAWGQVIPKEICA